MDQDETIVHKLDTDEGGKQYIIRTIQLGFAHIVNIEVLQYFISNDTLNLDVQYNDSLKVKILVCNFFLQHRIELHVSVSGSWDVYIEKPYDEGIRRVVAVHRWWSSHEVLRGEIRKELFLALFDFGRNHEENADGEDDGYESANNLSDECLPSDHNLLVEML